MIVKEFIMAGPEGFKPYRVTYLGVTATLTGKLYEAMADLEIKSWDISKAEDAPAGYYIDIELEE